ncbi:unnamed protein product [Durusdinium trenchii]|uniref:Uncharacterized protein n=1 Tax=Durusdinium trenchii TaxID=1381693 RepID=A0ABP0RFN1_9DINO
MGCCGSTSQKCEQPTAKEEKVAEKAPAACALLCHQLCNMLQTMINLVEFHQQDSVFLAWSLSTSAAQCFRIQKKHEDMSAKCLIEIGSPRSEHAFYIDLFKTKFSRVED